MYADLDSAMDISVIIVSKVRRRDCRVPIWVTWKLDILPQGQNMDVIMDLIKLLVGALQRHGCRMLIFICLLAGGCKAIVSLLKHDNTAVQDAAVFATASLMKWNLADVKRNFAHNEGWHLFTWAPHHCITGVGIPLAKSIGFASLAPVS